MVSPKRWRRPGNSHAKSKVLFPPVYQFCLASYRGWLADDRRANIRSSQKICPPSVDIMLAIESIRVTNAPNVNMKPGAAFRARGGDRRGRIRMRRELRRPGVLWAVRLYGGFRISVAGMKTGPEITEVVTRNNRTTPAFLALAAIACTPSPLSASTLACCCDIYIRH
jgi:hypothetical protein